MKNVDSINQKTGKTTVRPLSRNRFGCNVPGCKAILKKGGINSHRATHEKQDTSKVISVIEKMNTDILKIIDGIKKAKKVAVSDANFVNLLSERSINNAIKKVQSRVRALSVEDTKKLFNNKNLIEYFEEMNKLSGKNEPLRNYINRLGSYCNEPLYKLIANLGNNGDY